MQYVGVGVVYVHMFHFMAFSTASIEFYGMLIMMDVSG